MTVTSKVKNRAAHASAPLWDLVWEWVARPLHYRAVHAFRVAAETGDVERLGAMLDPAVAVVVESQEWGRSGARVTEGADDAIALLVHGMGRRSGRSIVERSVNGQAGLLLSDDGEPRALMNVDFSGRLISVVWIRLHPEMQRFWNRV